MKETFDPLGRAHNFIEPNPGKRRILRYLNHIEKKLTAYPGVGVITDLPDRDKNAARAIHEQEGRVPKKLPERDETGKKYL